MSKIAEDIEEKETLFDKFDRIYRNQPLWFSHLMFVTIVSIGMFVIFHDDLGF